MTDNTTINYFKTPPIKTQFAGRAKFQMTYIQATVKILFFFVGTCDSVSRVYLPGNKLRLDLAILTRLKQQFLSFLATGGEHT